MDTQETRIQVIFRVDTPHGTYQDALWFSQEEYDNLKQEDLDKMKQERIDNWIKVVTTPALELSKAEKEKQIQDEIYRMTVIIQNLQEEITNIK